MATATRRNRKRSLVDLGARHDGPIADRDAERWLNEGGSFSREALTR